MSRLLLAGGAVVLMLAVPWIGQRPYWHGPPSDHFDGRRFYVPGHPIGKGLLDAPDMLRWLLTGRRGPWPDAMLPIVRDRPPQRVTGAALRASWVGHATVLVQTHGVNLLTDPVWSPRAGPLPWIGPRRIAEPGIAFTDLPVVDMVWISHSHFDHLDLATLRRLVDAHDPLLVVAPGTDTIIRGAIPQARLQVLDWWQSHEVGDGLRVHAVPVYHWSRRGPFDRNKALWAGFVLETPSGAVYFAGDSGFGDGRFFAEAGARFDIRLALLPIGAYAPRWFMRPQHMRPLEAVRAHLLLGARRSFGIHHGTFRLSDEGYADPPAELAAARLKLALRSEDFVTVPVGGVLHESAPGTSPHQ